MMLTLDWSAAMWQSARRLLRLHVQKDRGFAMDAVKLGKNGSVHWRAQSAATCGVGVCLEAMGLEGGLLQQLQHLSVRDLDFLLLHLPPDMPLS